MKILKGRDLADFIKEKQARQTRQFLAQKIQPKLLIIRDSENPVIMKYVGLKKQYGEDIGVEVEDFCANSKAEIETKIAEANNDPKTHGIIVQLPLKTVEKSELDEVLGKINVEKDVDGLTGKTDTATAVAINWLIAGHGLDLKDLKIAIVGRGRLVGAPLIRMWTNSGYDITVFGHDGDLKTLKDFDVIVTATGVPHLITSEMVKPGCILIDAGTAAEDGVLVGDVDEAVRSREDLKAITPKVGGVGPLTVCALFDGVLNSV
ncbi:bifunctional 5,10-methylenetetrahydrofolate dehydrogenase/5,10-methenyltetrahydrofolate cyclohydrolase [Candidatus Saccharibacteria bacterium]|nr:bifunctional 5,10-methylenetetrahydrofolate dehydrogenase/5,10-methenyltetrahydrofolate cyclohydrolase [Candidatus Saccharibacteria bacterium]